METIKLANNIFKEIVFNNTPFSLALKNEWKYKNIESKDRSLITALVGCSLRHFYTFESCLKKYIESPSENLKSLVFISLSNSLFLKRLDEKNITTHCKKVMSEEDFDIYEKVLKENSEPAKLLPEDINVNSLDFLAYKYNTPLWLIKMWNKHFGLSVVYKILKNNCSPLKTYVKSVSNSDISNQDFIKKDENFYEYIGQTNLKVNPLFESKNLFSYPISMNDMVKKVDLDAVRGIAIYQGYANNILLDVVSKTSKYIRLDVISPTFQVLYETKKYIAKYNLENVSLYEASAASMITCISKKVHTLFVMPNNSRFAMLRSTPDYFLRIDQSKLDEYLAEEKTSLNEACNFVEDGGSLVYCVNTINQKEGHLMIEEFLQNHEDFSLVEEKQKFGFGDGDSCLYYAILVRGVNRD